MKENVVAASTRKARNMFSGKAHHLPSISDRISNSTEVVQSFSGKKIDRLAGQIRHLGRRLDRQEEIDFLARRLEETADYLRFRPLNHMARDVFRAAKKNYWIPVVGSALAGFAVYRMLSSRHR